MKTISARDVDHVYTTTAYSRRDMCRHSSETSTLLPFHLCWATPAAVAGACLPSIII